MNGKVSGLAFALFAGGMDRAGGIGHLYAQSEHWISVGIDTAHRRSGWVCCLRRLVNKGIEKIKLGRYPRARVSSYPHAETPVIIIVINLKSPARRLFVYVQ
jgi:hypothetical protein